LTDNNNENNGRALYNIIIAYPEYTKAIVTMPGFNKEHIKEEVLKQFAHIKDLKIETIDLIDGEESDTNNVVQFEPKEKA